MFQSNPSDQQSGAFGENPYASGTFAGAPPAEKSSGSNGKIILISALVIAVAIVAGALLLNSSGNMSETSEKLPDHIGMFLRSSSNDSLTEIKKQDFSNAVTAAATLAKDESLTTVPPSPTLVFNMDSKDFNISDLRLVVLDTLKSDGSMKQIDFQASQIAGKAEMKRISISGGLANGKYAFALFEGYLDEGTHKLWPFKVTAASKNDNGDTAKLTTVSVKSKTPSGKVISPTSTVPQAPPTTGLRTVVGRGVRVRVGPGGTYGYFRDYRLNYGDQVNVIGYSNWDCYAPNAKGCAYWAQIEGGYYVHGSLLR